MPSEPVANCLLAHELREFVVFLHSSTLYASVALKIEMNASCLVGTRGAIMTADFLFKGIFAIGVGSMAIAFLRDFLKAANASDSTPTVVPGGVDAAH